MSAIIILLREETEGEPEVAILVRVPVAGKLHEEPI